MVERGRKKDGTIVSTVDTITDLGTLVIIDDPNEDDEIDTMKSRYSWSNRPHPLLPLPYLGMDTGVVEKDTKSDYRPGFMQHFDKKDDKKKVGRKGPQGPHDISYYFPDIPDGMDFRDFVSQRAVYL